MPSRQEITMKPLKIWCTLSIALVRLMNLSFLVALIYMCSWKLSLMSIHILVQMWVRRVLLKQGSCPQDFTDIIAHNIEMENIPKVKPWWKNGEWHRREISISAAMMVMTKDTSHTVIRVSTRLLHNTLLILYFHWYNFLQKE